MVANIPFNPNSTLNAGGTFGVSWNGAIQGTAMDEPAVRFQQASGLLSQSETLPMWGGVGISELVPTPQGSPPITSSEILGGPISRATNISLVGAALSLTGFSVFNQAYGMIGSPQSPVQLAASGMQVMFFRLGSLARIWVNMVPGLVSAQGVIITQQLSWDFLNQQLVPYSPAFTSGTISAATWAATAGGQTTFTVNVDYTTMLNAGDIVNISGVVNTGGSSTAAFNGQFVVVSVDATHIVVTQAAAVSPGTYASGGTVAAGGGALPVKILKTEIGNSMVVAYDPITGFATWNRQGSCALIQI